MTEWKIKKLFRLPSGQYMPCGLNLWERLWWRFVPGVIINVRWPTGLITAGPGPEDPRWVDYGGAAYVTYESADPNDHYRPFMEKYVGRQGWDWNWGMQDNDIAENRLTIKFRQAKREWAIIAALKWG